MFIDFISKHILSILIFFPILSACALFLIPHGSVSSRGLMELCRSAKARGSLDLTAGSSSQDGWLKHLALGIVFLEFIFSLHLISHYVPQSYDFQFASSVAWLPLPGVNYTVGIDGLSVYLVLLTTLMSLIVFLSVYSTVQTHIRTFLACFLILEGTLIGALVSLNLFLFYFFWEASLIPLYFMIGIWGGKNRIYATLKFFIYGVFGSLLMLVAFIYLYVVSVNSLGHYSANFIDIYHTAHLLPFSTQCLLFVATTLAFIIKIPVFPFYTWLTDTYEQAPAIYTMMSGIVLKLASYGIIRLSLCLFPAAAARYANVLLILGVVSILYGALVAWQQTNLRRIMAFSSLSHMGFILVGIFAFNTFGMQGALYQMINHSITAAAFFILFQFLEMGKTPGQNDFLNINEFGGLASAYPWFAFFFGLVAMSAVGLPSTGSFLGEWLILLGVFLKSPVLGTITILGIVFGAVYVLWFTYKVLFGTPSSSLSMSSRDSNMSSRDSSMSSRDSNMSSRDSNMSSQGSGMSSRGLTAGSTKIPSTLAFKGLSPIAVFQLGILCMAIFVLGFASNQIFKLSEPTLVHIQETLSNKTPYQADLTNKSGLQ